MNPCDCGGRISGQTCYGWCGSQEKNLLDNDDFETTAETWKQPESEGIDPVGPRMLAYLQSTEVDENLVREIREQFAQAMEAATPWKQPKFAESQRLVDHCHPRIIFQWEGTILRPFDDAHMWLENEAGEGMEISKSEVADCLRKLFAAKF